MLGWQHRRVKLAGQVPHTPFLRVGILTLIPASVRRLPLAG
jgi:hypothetical protein